MVLTCQRGCAETGCTYSLDSSGIRSVGEEGRARRVETNISSSKTEVLGTKWVSALTCILELCQGK